MRTRHHRSPRPLATLSGALPGALPAAVFAVAALGAAPAALHAQFVTVEARAGATRAVGRYADALGTAQTIGVGLGTRFTPTLSFRLDADASTGFDGGAASPDLYTYTAGLETELAPARGRRRSPLQLTALLSGGVTQIRYGSADPALPGLRTPAESQFRPLVGAGVRLAAELTRNLALFGGASATATLLGDSDDAAARLGGEGGTLVAVPMVAGVRVKF